MPKQPYEWRIDAHGCHKHDNAELDFGPCDQTAHLPVFLHLRTTNLPGPDSIMRSEQAQQGRMERAAGKYDRKRLPTLTLGRFDSSLCLCLCQLGLAGQG